MMTNRLMIAMLLGGSLAMAGCARRDRAAEPTPPPPAGPVQPAQPTAPAQPGMGVTTDDVRAGSMADFLRQAGSDRVFFAFDRYDLDAEARSTLERQAQWLRQHSGVRVTIEGHADERGTREYNLALGERRAIAARNFLAAQGVESGRMTIISYGKERPAVEGSNEAAWAQNRRAVTVLTSGVVN